MLKRTAPLLLSGVTLLALAACAPIQSTRGNVVTDDRLAEVEPGVTSRVQLQYAFGSPTSVGTVDNRIWYYVGYRTQQTAFFAPEVLDRRIFRVTFDENDIVKTIDRVDDSQIRAIDLVERETASAGRDVTFMEQLLGNLNRAPKKKEEEKKGRKG